MSLKEKYMKNFSMHEKYFKNWPENSCPYVQDLLFAEKIAKQYIDKIIGVNSTKKKCVIFDFDDCLIFGDPSYAVGVSEMKLGHKNGDEIFILPRNEPIVRIAEYAKSKGLLVFIITARPKESREATLRNCKEFKIPHDGLVMNEGEKDPCFKIHVRRKLLENYEIVLTVGDQITDCLCPGKSAFIKLPDPGEEEEVTDEETGEEFVIFKGESYETYAWIPSTF